MDFNRENKNIKHTVALIECTYNYVNGLETNTKTGLKTAGSRTCLNNKIKYKISLDFKWKIKTKYVDF